MRHQKVTETGGKVKAILAVAEKRSGNDRLGIQVRDRTPNLGGRSIRPLEFNVIRAHSTLSQDDTVIASVWVPRAAILRLTEQIKAEDAEEEAAVAYRGQRIEENKAAGVPLLTGADEHGNFPPRNSEGSN